MTSPFQFTFTNLEEQYRIALDEGYQFLTCRQYFLQKDQLPEKAVVNRVDIDVSVAKADRLRDLFDRLGIKATFFVRLHAAEYNPFSFENYRILKAIKQSGHEIGYHSEIIDQAAIWNEDPALCLRRDLELMSTMLGIPITGVASHGGMTGLNNLDFWKTHAPAEFSLDYEAYDNGPAFGLFADSFYVSDSEWTRWKCYLHGELCANDRRSFGEHARSGHALMYLLIHPETYCREHPYE